MPGHKLASFSGVTPKIASHLLEDSVATIAENCRVDSGRLEPIKTPLFLQTIPNTGTPKSMYFTGGNYIFWDVDVDVVGSLVGDINEEYHKGQITSGTTTTLLDINSPFKRLQVAPGMMLTNLTSGYSVPISSVNDTVLTHAEIALPHNTGDYYLITYTDGIDNRFYYTGNGTPKKSNATMAGTGTPSGGPTDEYSLGVPQPTTVISVEVTGEGYEAWDIDTQYKVGDTVKYDSAYYRLVTPLAGDVPIWNPTVFYYPYDIVTFNNQYFLVIEPPVPDDTPDYLGTTFYVTGDRFKYSGIYYQVIAPPSANTDPPPAVPTIWTQISGDVRTTSYIYTLETAWGEEGIPSRWTDSITLELGQTAKLSNISVPISMAYNFSYVNIYRLVTSSTTANYQLVTRLATSEFPSIQSTFVDNAPAENLGRACVSYNYNPPPEGLQGLTLFNNSVFAGFVKNEVYFAEPNALHAYPVEYVVTLPSKAQIVGLSSGNNCLYVLTTLNPYKIIGEDPRALSVLPMPDNQPCMAKKGILSTIYGTFYPSKEGYYALSPNGNKNLTADVYTSKQWASFPLADMISFFFQDSIYWFFYGTAVGYTLSLAEEANVKTIKLPFSVYGGYCDGEDLLLMGKSGDTFSVYKYDAGVTSLQIVWKSKDFLYTHGKSFSTGKIVANGAVDFTYYVDGVPQPFADGSTTKSVTTAQSFKLNGDKRGRKFAVQVKGYNTIDMVGIADQVSELK